ncbi:putative toxD protein [Rosellinia necatrix]|uniref:Putative toxD protein n=1 Tax=Rosellinia necatrix TaxID=77044 RepID=A0A1S7UJB5_ROSNE|nr:putative toxD protein [Rosellinia necatrix]
MDTNKALVIVEKGKVEIRDVPLPKVPEGHILVKVRAVGVNPTDWKSIDSADAGRIGSRSGCDYAGEVVEVGPGVTQDIKKGDRSSGFVFGASWSTPDNGAFGEYVVAKPHVQLKIPDNVTDEEAATFGVSITTVGQGLYKTLRLPLPDDPAKTPFPVLIYGGSTATGLYGIKFAKASGLTVIATASPHNFALVRAAGADHVFDYRSPTVGAEIRALTADGLRHAWDCTGHGAAVCAAALSSHSDGDGDGEGEGEERRRRPRYATIIPVPRAVFDDLNPAVDGPHFTLGYDALGVTFPRLDDPAFTPDPAEARFAAAFWALARRLLAAGALAPLRPEVNRFGAGLEGVVRGLDELRNDRVSGTKLVYTL